MTICPCGSGAAFADCCGPIIDGAAAPTAEALMRSRYTAFSMGRIEHLDATHAPEVREDFNHDEAERTAREVTWTGLEILRAEESADGTGVVEFVARFEHGGQTLNHRERARFRRIDDRWMYVDGDVNFKHPPRHVEKIGRNDACPCGSGKKYKKCCGK
ncbi:YchJ family protein [bacterium]|nr:YchJ family protein [bacterium]